VNEKTNPILSLL